MDWGEIRCIVEGPAKHNVICEGVDWPNEGSAYGRLDSNIGETNGAQKNKTLNAMKILRSCWCFTETSRIAKPTTNSNPPHGRARVIDQDLYLLHKTSVSAIADKNR